MSNGPDLPEEYRDIPHDFFRYGTGKYSDIILLPQPSDSPNDPLNWPQVRKEVILLILSLNAAVVGAFGPMLGPGFVQIAQQLDVSIAILSESTAWAVLAIGLSLFIISPLAKIYGRRPMFLFSSVVMLGTSIWGAMATDYPSLLGARVLAGVGMAPYETLVQCVMGDIYFVHERATRIAFWNLLLMAGINGGTVVAGYIIEAEGYRWTFGACAVIFGVLTVAVFFLVPETGYRRDILTPIVTIDDYGNKGLHMRPKYQINLQGEDYQGRYIEISAMERKKTFGESLHIFNGRLSSGSFWKVFLRSIVMMCYPAVIWAFLTYGTEITWVIIFSVVNSSFFSAPPYNFTVAQVGLISMSPFILTSIGFCIAGPLNDYIVVYLTRKNRGIYEPEFRLPLMVVAIILGIIGFFGFGLTIYFQTHWTGPVLCFGTAYLSLVFSSTCVFGYILDSYRKHNAEAFVAINSRNLLGFGVTYLVTPWLEKDGPLKVFIILGFVFVSCSLLSVPLWIYGKRFRSFTGKTRWLVRLMED
ncbi:hypothetical protein N0V93_008524 [Gnomoniopsis smithogilvyi]|uniref:Major facilitator superfamily (MFS) profile domain-containing protein n=1 Tax=Gnomoniopsis smithogilvyi TaxID=1191159 RepID=A0A9W8YND1_9PEZI|nr:hypothetical protein N0V93_008524 [Gnomoniopsis smithogilvyi]